MLTGRCPPAMTPTASARPLRVGLAGVGRFGQLHADVLAHLPGVELAALADADPLQLSRVADRHGVMTRHADALELIADDSLDAVVLATPDEQHGPQARAALAQGRHLFVEKPLAPDWQQARELQQLAVEAGLTLQTGLILRYEPSHRELQQQMAAGAFGDPVSIRARRNCRRTSFAAIADRIHTVHRTLIHDIDLVLWLTQSRVTSVMAMEVRQGDHLAPLGCFALLRLADGSVAQLRGDAIALWPVCEGRVGGALRDQLADFCTCVSQHRPSQVADLTTAVEALRVAEAVIEAGRRSEVVSLGPRP